MGKGSNRRPTNEGKYRDNYEGVFGGEPDTFNSYNLKDLLEPVDYSNSIHPPNTLFGTLRELRLEIGISLEDI